MLCLGYNTLKYTHAHAQGRRCAAAHWRTYTRINNKIHNENKYAYMCCSCSTLLLAHATDTCILNVVEKVIIKFQETFQVSLIHLVWVRSLVSVKSCSGVSDMHAGSSWWSPKKVAGMCLHASTMASWWCSWICLTWEFCTELRFVVLSSFCQDLFLHLIRNPSASAGEKLDVLLPQNHHHLIGFMCHDSTKYIICAYVHACICMFLCNACVLACVSVRVRVCACMSFTHSNKNCSMHQINSFYACGHANGGICMHVCLFSCMYAYAYACERCGVHSKNLQVSAHSHNSKNKMQAHLLQAVSRAVSLGLLIVLSMRSFLSFMRINRSDRTSEAAWIRLMSLFSRAVRTVFALARGRSGTSLLGNDGWGYALARCGSLCYFLCLWSDAHHKLAIRKMKTMDTSRLLASTKHHNSTGQDGSGKLTLMFACFCLSYHAQQAFPNGQGSLTHPLSPFEIFFSSLTSFRSPSSRARLCLENG